MAHGGSRKVVILALLANLANLGIAVWSGPERVLVALEFSARDGGGTAASLVDRVNAAERAARAALPEIAWLFVEPDFES